MRRREHGRCEREMVRGGCYRCGEAGHLVKECTSEDALCYNCLLTGHISKECPEEPKERPPTSRRRPREKCYKCGKSGHQARDCRGSEMVCYNCRGDGHIARECPSQEDSEQMCYNCSGTGHIARNCASDPSAPGCYQCGEPGIVGPRFTGHNLFPSSIPVNRGPNKRNPSHIIRDCRNKRGFDSCYSCGGRGHIARDCPSDGRDCYKCGGQGHLRKECPNSDTCYNCGQPGHIAKGCDQPDNGKRARRDPDQPVSIAPLLTPYQYSYTTNKRATDAMRRVTSPRTAARLRMSATPATNQVTLPGTVSMLHKKKLHPPSCVRRYKETCIHGYVLPWLQCVAMVTTCCHGYNVCYHGYNVCCHGYNLLPWLQRVAMVTTCYHVYNVLPWLQRVAMRVCEREEQRVYSYIYPVWRRRPHLRVWRRHTRSVVGRIVRVFVAKRVTKVRFKRLDLRFLEIGVLLVIFTKRDPEFPGISGQVV
eukprot:sb/3464291/